jgi:Glycosyltransferase like family 2
MAAALDILLGPHSSLPSAELARAIEAELQELGRAGRTVHDRLRQPSSDLATLVIAPHEVLPHVDADQERLAAFLQRSVLLVLAHPTSAAWAASLPYVEHAGALLHVSDAGIAAFKRLGRRARRFPLGYHRAFDRWGGADTPRTVDVAFLGTLTPRRSRLLAQAAGVLSRRSVELRLPERPATAADRAPDFLGGDAKLDLLARTRVLLDLHADEEEVCAWLRAVQAIANGCIVVAESAGDVSPLQPELHLVQTRPGQAHLAVDALLDDAERLERLRFEAYRFLRDELPLRQSVEPVLALADDLPRAAHTRRRRPSPSSSAREPTPATPPDERFDRLFEQVAKQNAVLKKLFLDLRLLRRQVAQVSHALSEPERPLVASTRTPAAEVDGFQPDVTVVISLYNYARFVREALASAVASEAVTVEIVVVDDASTDGSSRVVRAFMDEHPHAAVTLVEQRVNTGAQRSRNLAFSLGRAPMAFVLDADNVVYPSGIAKLRAALEADPGAGFAYGLMERFSEHASLDLMNTSAWDKERLAQEPYIDAMALVRVDCFKQVGGYVTEQTLELGLEDYDLWLSFAMAGFHAAYVREIVGRYRVHGVSSLTMTTLDTDELMAKLRERHAPFFASVPKRS